ncbi:MAG: serine/threonine-protein kinase [Planctomycetota bacterium]|jgi:serine/threonine protein kinase|nr:serine/threonine-protein kinase [Planctomycetota bacterium]
MSQPTSIADLPPGTVIGGYRLAGLLGKGGMGAVYLAEQLSIGRKVALKLVSAKRLGGKVDSFVREARTAAQLQHPSLVAVHEVGAEANLGLYYYSMEYIHGRTLFTVVQQEGSLPPDRVRTYALQVTSALAHAHRQGLIHRDVKPENIMIDEHGNAKLADLGLAADQLGGRGRVLGNRVLSVVGTPGWSAPEQMRNPERTCAQSDIFALGCVIAFMITGKQPFEGETLIDLAVRVATEPVAGLEDLPESWQDIVEELTAKDPLMRPSHGAAAMHLIEHGPEPRSDSSPSVGSSARRRRRARRR